MRLRLFGDLLICVEREVVGPMFVCVRAGAEADDCLCGWGWL